MAADMSPQASRLLSHLQKLDSETFLADLVPLLEDFVFSTKGTEALHPHRVTLDDNVEQSLPLVQPLLSLLSSDQEVPYSLITRALSVLLAPLPFARLKEMGLYPFIVQGLQVGNANLQILALEQVQKIKDVDGNITGLLIACLGAVDASVGKKAVDLITIVLPFMMLSQDFD